MSVKLIKLLTKTPDQDWSGKHLNVKTARNTAPDPRDAGDFTLTERKILRMESRFNIRNCDGYQGWDREYLGDHNLKIIYYFDTVENAKKSANYKNPTIRNSYTQIVETKTTSDPKARYSFVWLITDENDKILEVLETRGP